MKNKTIIICLIIIALGIMLTVKIVNNNTQSNLAQSKHSEKVNISEFKENLRKYFMAEKVANTKVNKKNNDGETIEIKYTTDGLKLKEEEFKITDNHIEVTVMEDMVYKWDYQINEKNAVFTVKKQNPTVSESIKLVGNTSNLSIMFVTYLELLGITPNEALEYWYLAIRNENKQQINENQYTITNEIFKTTEEKAEDGLYSFVLEINNENIMNFSDLLKEARTK